MVTTQEMRLRELLERAAAELAAQREDVLSGTLIWPRRGLEHDRCAAFLKAIDAELAVIEAAGYVSVPHHGRLSLLRRSGVGVGVVVDSVTRVGQLAG